jgi:hypothetical protein
MTVAVRRANLAACGVVLSVHNWGLGYLTC